MGMCEWVSDSRDSAWLANPCELRIRITGLLWYDVITIDEGEGDQPIEPKCRVRK